MEITTQLVNHLLKEREVWITTPRLKLMELFIKNNEKMISHDDIYTALLKKNLGRVTIYRTLLYFCNIGVIYKILDSKSKPFYSLEAGIYPPGEPSGPRYNEHYHFNCIQCGSFIRLPENAADAVLPFGHIKTATNLLVMGYCDNCSKEKKTRKIISF